ILRDKETIGTDGLVVEGTAALAGKFQKDLVTKKLLKDLAARDRNGPRDPARIDKAVFQYRGEGDKESATWLRFDGACMVKDDAENRKTLKGVLTKQAGELIPVGVAEGTESFAVISDSQTLIERDVEGIKFVGSPRAVLQKAVAARSEQDGVLVTDVNFSVTGQLLLEVLADQEKAKRLEDPQDALSKALVAALKATP